MKCQECRYWQGNSLSEWADCYRVVGKLEPNLLCCHREDEDRPGVEFYFSTPFDPHDWEYWKYHPFLKKLYGLALERASTYGIRTDDLYFVTHKDFDCEVIDEDK